MKKGGGEKEDCRDGKKSKEEGSEGGWTGEDRRKEGRKNGRAFGSIGEEKRDEEKRREEKTRRSKF